MSTYQKALRNSKILFLTEIVNLVAGIAIVVMLARLLNVAALGLYSFSFSVGSVLAIACLYGANQLIIREIARDPKRLSGLLGNSLAARITLAIALMSLTAITFIFLGYSRESTLTILLLVLVRVLESFIFMFCAFFRGFEEMHFESGIRGSLNVINVGIGIPVLYFTRSLYTFSVIQCLLTIVVLIVSYQTLVRRYAAKPFSMITRKECLAVIKQGLNFSLYMILLVFYVQINTILLTFFRGHEATGLYTAGFRFISALGLVASSTVGALFPVISRLNIRDHTEEIRLAYTRSTKYLLVIASFASLALFVFAPTLIQFIYGRSFLPAAVGLRIMAFSILFSFINTSSCNLMFSLNKEKKSLRILAICVGFVVVSNLIILPIWGYLGACLTTLLPEFINFGLQYRAITDAIPEITLLPVLSKFGLLLAAVVGATLGWPGIPLLLQGALFLVSFAGSLYLFRIFQPDEIAFLKNRYFRRSQPHANT